MNEMPLVFNDIADGYDSWFETPEGKKVKALELDTLLRMVGDVEGRKMLEVGIGTGLFAMEFRARGAEVVGIDPAPRMVEIARLRGFDVQIAYGENLPFPDDSFDIVFSMTAMENSHDPKKFLSEMVRVTKKDGIVVVAVLNLLSLYGLYRKLFGWKKQNLIFRNMHFFTWWELKKLMKKYVQQVEITSSVFFPPNPSSYFLKHAYDLEKLGQRWAKPLGALLVSRGLKKNC